MDSYESLLLNKSLHKHIESYGFWFDKLNYRLEDQHFDPSDYDPFMFIYDKLICLVYVDDCILFTNYSKYIDGLMNYFQK